MEAVIILEDDEILVKQKLSKKKVPNFMAIGNGTINKDGLKSISLIAVMEEGTAASRWLIRKITEGINYDNDYSPIVRISKSTLTATEQKYLTAGYRELFQQGLVKRVKNGSYMLHPAMVIKVGDYEKWQDFWDSLPAYASPTPAPTPAPTVFTIDRGNI